MKKWAPMQQKVQFLSVTDDEQGQRLDNYLMSRLKGVPKSALYKIIRKGEVRVNKGRAKPERKLCSGDIIRVPPIRTSEQKSVPKPSDSLSEYLQSATLYDQDGLLIVNKPSGLAVHGGSGLHLGMIEALRQLPTNKGFLELIHRLDKDTSGCVMIARKRSTLKFYQDALRRRAGIEKTYWALVQGQWPEFQRAVSAPLKRFVLAGGDRVVRVNADGKEALTQFEVMQRYQQTSLVQAKPVTGRTHQIRVHAKHIGCPLVGDSKYGDTELNTQLYHQGLSRLFLHAHSLQFSTPENETVKVEAELPEELQLALSRLN